MYALPPAIPATTGTHLQTTGGSAPARQGVSTSVAPMIVQRVEVVPQPSRSDLLVDTEQWTWQELRDFVASQIVDRFGPFPRDARKEYGIFNRYFASYGANGIAVAKFSFGPVLDGWWGKAPISVNRFCKASDPYFTVPILERLAEMGALQQA